MASCGRVNMAICCCNPPGNGSSGAHWECEPVGCQFKPLLPRLEGWLGGESRTWSQMCLVKSLKGGGSGGKALWPSSLLPTTHSAFQWTCCCQPARTIQQKWLTMVKWAPCLWNDCTWKINSTSQTKRVCRLPILRSAASQVLCQIAINAGAQSLKGIWTLA